MDSETTIGARGALRMGASLDTGEIAALLGVTSQAVRTRMKRAGATPIKGGVGRNAKAHAWSCEDYERVYPRLAEIRGLA